MAIAAAKAPSDMQLADAKGKEAAGMKLSMQISSLDCTGCGSCVESCPASGKALRMEKAGSAPSNGDGWEYARALSTHDKVFDPTTVKGSRFRQPLPELSAACAGCPETVYARLIPQLFGGSCHWLNAAGCSQSRGAATPSFPCRENQAGHGPTLSSRTTRSMLRAFPWPRSAGVTGCAWDFRS